MVDKEEIIKFMFMFELFDELNKAMHTLYESRKRVLLIQRKICRRKLKRIRTMQLHLMALADRNNSIKTVTNENCSTEKNSVADADSFFKENYRMSRKSFDILCDHLSNSEKQSSIPLNKRVAIALYALGSSADYRTIENLFDVGISTVETMLIEFCQEICRSLGPLHLKSFPLTQSTITDCVAGFNNLGFPQCLGALDCCHIEVHPPAEDATDYYNYKGQYSIILMALVDYRYRFLYINVGCPGRFKESYVYEESQLKEEIENCSLLDEMSKELGKATVPVGIIGNSSFRLSKWLMKPYHCSLENNNSRREYNRHLYRSQHVAKKAFGHLKGRFRRIANLVDNETKNINIIIKACCVLHNFLNNHNDVVNSSWCDTTNNRDTDSRDNDTLSIYDIDTDSDAEQLRNAIAAYLGASSDGDVDMENDDDDNWSNYDENTNSTDGQDNAVDPLFIDLDSEMNSSI